MSSVFFPNLALVGFGGSLVVFLAMAVVATRLMGERGSSRGISHRLLFGGLAVLVLLGLGIQRTHMQLGLGTHRSHMHHAHSHRSATDGIESDRSDSVAGRDHERRTRRAAVRAKPAAASSTPVRDELSAEASSAQMELEAMYAALTEPQIQLDEAASTAEEAKPDDTSTVAASRPDTDAVDSPSHSDVPPSSGEVASSAAERPTWLGKRRHHVGNVVREVVTSDPFQTVDECNAQLDQRAVVAAAMLLEELVGGSDLDGLKSLEERYPIAQDLVDRLGIDAAYIRGESSPEGGFFVETKQLSVGEMQVAHLLLEFGPGIQREFVDRQRASTLHDRVALVVVGTLLVVGMLTIFYALLRFDTATKGYYTRRLIVGVPLAIMAFVVLMLALAI